MAENRTGARLRLWGVCRISDPVGVLLYNIQDPSWVIGRRVCCSIQGRLNGSSVALQRRVYALGPSLYAADDIAHTRKALGAEKLGHAQAASAVMAMDEQVFIAG